MISGLQANTPSFLASLSGLENRLSQVNQQISSGYRMNQASDDPTAIAPILAYQGRLDYINQIKTNLGQAQTEAQSADSALQQASSLMDQLVSLGSQGASSTSTASSRTVLGQKVQAIEQQLVNIANTAVNGRYIFGGDDGNTTPYTYTGSGSNGVTQNSTSANTQILRDSDGNEITPRMTADQIFDSSSGSIFEAAFNLGNALLSNNPSGFQTAITAVSTSQQQLAAATTNYGNIENWISSGISSATSHVNSLTAALSAVRDADLPTLATQLTADQTAMQAAISADGSLNVKSLFDYMG